MQVDLYKKMQQNIGLVMVRKKKHVQFYATLILSEIWATWFVIPLCSLLSV